MPVEAPKTITRYNLVMALSKQYNYQCPIILEKDGNDQYDFMESKIRFKCCQNYEHKHYMSPLRILQLRYMYGLQPCPICHSLGYTKKDIEIAKKNINLTEDGSDMEKRKMFLDTDDPVEKAKRESKLQSEVDEYKNKLNKKKNGPQRSPQFGEEPIGPVREDVLAESMSLEDYLKENPDFENNTLDINNINVNDAVGAEILPEEEYIADSFDYDEYAKTDNEFANKTKIIDPIFDKIKNVKMSAEDLFFENGKEEGMMRVEVDNQGKIITDSSNIPEQKSREKHRPQRSDNFNNNREQFDIQESKENNLEKTNKEDKNILFNDTDKNNFEVQETKLNIEDDDEFEDFKIGEYV